jgi:hypothetical protein
MGWRIQETDTEVRLIPPGISDSLVEIDTILGDSDDEAEEDVAPVFTLEHQLRDFLAENIHTVSVNGKRLKLIVDQK